MELMRRRRGRERDEELCSGPGKLTEALGLGLERNGAALTRPPFEVLPRSGEWRDVEVTTGPRIGITKAVDNPWRFCASGSPFVSRPWPAARAA
jgi:DNA-3-methyladenine glycosylase